jgi:spore maturation protein CgeB
MNTLEKNLAVLRRRQPEAAALLEAMKRSSEAEPLQSERGDIVHRCRGRLLHSKWDPRREAGLLAAKQARGCRCVFGFGDGYHLEALLEKGETEALVVLEPDGGLLRAVLEDRNLAHLLERISLIVGAPPAQAADRLADPVEHWCIHPPSGQLHRRYLEAVEGLSSYRSRADRCLRILVVGPVYGGSYPVACFVSGALRGLGHAVSFMDVSAFHPGYREIRSWEAASGPAAAAFEGFLSGLVEQRAAALSPDLVLLLAQAPVRGESLQRLREAGIRVAYWFVEDHRRMPYWRRIAPFTDVFFVIQRQGRDEMRSEGAPCVRYLPLAAQRGVHEPIRLPSEALQRYGAQVSFVGAGYLNRRRFMERLVPLGLKIWGNEWDGASSILHEAIQEGGRRVETEEIVQIFNASQINLNLHSSPCHEDVDPFGDFVNPRTFEIASCGGFQLVDRRSLLDELFAGEEIAVFENLEDAREKIRYFLAHPEEREAYARRGRRRVLEEHTYDLRMKELLGVLYANGLEGRTERCRNAGPAAPAESQALAPSLAASPGPGLPELEEIVAGIRKKKEITWEDRVFLTLMAFKEEARCKASSS